MPTDLQIIDGFERLREIFFRENPGFEPRSKPSDGADAPERIIAAWLQAIDGRPAAAGAAHRRLRAMTLTILDPARDLDLIDIDDRPLVDQGRVHADRVRTACANGNGAHRSVAEEIRAWQKVLPGLAGVRAWRFLAALDRPIIAPESSLRRMLWRIGEIDRRSADDASLLATHDALRRIARLTGLATPLLGVLTRWATVESSGWKAGGWCAGKPRCGECPLRPACAYARFQPADGEEPRPAALRDAGETLRRQIVQGRQEHMQEVELLAVLLPNQTAGQTGLEIAESLLRRFGGLRGIERASITELARVRGISAGRAAQIKAALELGRRAAAQRLQPGDPIRSSEDVWQAYRARFRNLPQEHFVILLLDAKNRVMQDHVVSKGTLTGSLAHPREVFQQAVRQSAAGVILLHNHPSGDPSPSPEDREVTRRLRNAGEILGIRVLDHIILGADDYTSFKDEDIL